MLKRFGWAAHYGALAALFIFLPPANCKAQPNPPQEQSAAQGKEAPAQAAIPPPDSITVPDGTPLTLTLAQGLSSATAKAGDPVEFTTAYSVRVNGLVIVPRGTTVAGTVVQVNHAHRPAKNAQVYVKVEKLVLPTGELLTLRPRQPGSEKMKSARKEEGEPPPPAWLWPVVPLDPAAWILVCMLPFVKGHEQEYPAGTRTTIYVNGPVSLDRSALLKLQPPPYKGPAQVYFMNKSVFLFNKKTRTITCSAAKNSLLELTAPSERI